MAAIITDDFRRNQARLLVNDIKASASGSFSDTEASNSYPYRGNNRYAIGLGKSDSWPNDSNNNSESNSGFIIPTPNGTIQENHDISNNLFTLKDIASTGVKQLIAKNPWTPNRKYKVYDQTDDDMFYTTGDLYPTAVTVGTHIYLCLSNTARNGGFTTLQDSTISPSTANYDIGVPGSDGYVWVHVATFNSSDALSTSQFSPVDEQSPNAGEIVKTGGILSHIGVVNGGSGYSTSSPPAAVLTLTTARHQVVSSTTINLQPVVVNGAVTRVDIRDVNSNPTEAGSYEYWTNHASDFEKSASDDRVAFATVTFTGGGSGSGAEAYASITPISGFAKNALDVLPAWFVGITTEFDGSETDGDAPTIPFRQVSLLKNFVKNESDSAGAGEGILDCLNSINITGTSATVSAIGQLLPGAVLSSSTSKFYFDYYVPGSGNNGTLYYHQNSNAEINQVVPPAVGTTPVMAGSTTIATDITAVDIFKEYDIFTPSGTNPNKRNGEVIFQENRKPFSRSTSQTEEVKLIIQL